MKSDFTEDPNSDLKIIGTGRIVSATTSSTFEEFCKLKINRIESGRAEEIITEELAFLEGMESVNELKTLLNTFYPLFDNDCEVIVYYFEVHDNK